MDNKNIFKELLKDPHVCELIDQKQYIEFLNICDVDYELNNGEITALLSLLEFCGAPISKEDKDKYILQKFEGLLDIFDDLFLAHQTNITEASIEMMLKTYFFHQAGLTYHYIVNLLMQNANQINARVYESETQGMVIAPIR